MYSFYTPKEELTTCTDRYEKHPDLIYLGSTNVMDLFCSATCPCTYDLDATIVTALGAGIDATTGTNNLQGCSTFWNSKLDRGANLLKYLEESYKCRGFCADPTNEKFTYSSVKQQSIPTQCQGQLDTYMEQVLSNLSGIYFGSGLIVLVLLLSHCLLFAMNIVKSERGRRAPNSKLDETISKMNLQSLN